MYDIGVETKTFYEFNELQSKKRELCRPRPPFGIKPTKYARLSPLLSTGVNKKPKYFKTVWHGFQGILKLSGRVNQASLKLSASFSISVSWTYKSDYMGDRTMTVPNCCRISNQKILRLFSMHIFSKLKNLDVYTLFNTSTV